MNILLPFQNVAMVDSVQQEHNNMDFDQVYRFIQWQTNIDEVCREVISENFVGLENIVLAMLNWENNGPTR